jgi:hypothetical protein
MKHTISDAAIEGANGMLAARRSACRQSLSAWSALHHAVRDAAASAHPYIVRYMDQPRPFVKKSFVGTCREAIPWLWLTVAVVAPIEETHCD